MNTIPSSPSLLNSAPSSRFVGILSLGMTVIGLHCASAAIMVDFNDNDNGPKLTQTGYTAITQTGGSFSSDLAVGGTATVGVTVNSANSSALDDRDRGALVGGPGLAQSDLLRDFLFFNSNFASSMDITVSTLKAGTYTFTGYFHDNTVQHSPFDLSVNTGSGFTLMIDEGGFSTGTSPNPVGIHSFNFTSDGTNPVIFRMDDLNGTNDNSGVIAGFEIAAVPEPSSVALVGCFGLFMMMRRRRL